MTKIPGIPEYTPEGVDKSIMAAEVIFQPWIVQFLREGELDENYRIEASQLIKEFDKVCHGKVIGPCLMAMFRVLGTMLHDSVTTVAEKYEDVDGILFPSRFLRYFRGSNESTYQDLTHAINDADAPMERETFAGSWWAFLGVTVYKPKDGTEPLPRSVAVDRIIKITPQ